MNLLDKIRKILADKAGAMFNEEITEELQRRHQELEEMDKVELIRKVGNCLSKYTLKNKSGDIQRVKNGKGGNKLCCYVWKVNQTPRTPRIRASPEYSRDAAAVGAGGEFLTMGELTLRGIIVSKPTIDTGVDLYVNTSRGNIDIQVKTTTFNNNKYSVKIRKSTFKKTLDHRIFYIFVCRKYTKKGADNLFVIVHGSVLEDYLPESKGEQYNITIVISKDGKFLLNNRLDVTDYVNRFDKLR